MKTNPAPETTKSKSINDVEINNGNGRLTQLERLT